MASSLSVIVPIYNEEATLASVMAALSNACPDAEIVYVNDGSRDASLDILHANVRPQDTVLSKENGGKGSAILHGLRHAKGEYTVIQDADLEYDPHQIPMLLREAEMHHGTVIFGSRFLKPNPNIYKRYLLGNKALTLCLNILYGSSITDSYTCYKLLPTDLFRSLNIQSHGFEMEAEIASKCLKRKIPIRELPVTYKPRRLEEGKKIRFSDAWKGLMMMIAVRFSNYS